MHGYVYVIQADNGLVKIGKASHLESRLRSLNSVLPYELRRIYHFKVEHYHELEIYLHNRFAYARIRGEWFQLSEEEIHSIPGVAASMPTQLRFDSDGLDP